MIKLQFKFKEHASKANRNEVIDVLFDHGANDVRPLFPDETDKELSSLFIADCQDDVVGQELMGLLNGFEVVEFVEDEIRRRLIP